MNLRTLKEDQLQRLAATSWGEQLNADSAIADALRAELWARRTAIRRSLCRKVVELMAPVRNVEQESVRRVLDQLERDGDVTGGDGGLIAPAPIRAIELGDDRYLLVGGPETARLKEIFGSDIGVQMGLRRATGCGDRFLEALSDVGGLVLTPDRWAGLDRTPPADEKWLAILDDELEHLGADADALPSECTDDWRCYVPRAASLHHRRWEKPSADGAAQVWRCRHDRGYWLYLWTRGVAPSESSHLRLPGDAALRAMFALDRSAGHPIELEISEDEDHIVLNARGMLPRAEYRYLMTFGERSEEDGFRYRVPSESWAQVSSMLTSRLGVVIAQEGST